MTPSRLSPLETRIHASVTDEDRRIPFVLGLCGTGRTTLLRRLQGEVGAENCQYVNVERTATTPERFLRALTAASPFEDARHAPQAASPREAFDAVLGFFASATRADGGPATFLLDEVLEFRTFESFPGLRKAFSETLAVLASGPNRFVLTSRYVTRTERLLASAPPNYFVAPTAPLGREDVAGMLSAPADGTPTNGTSEVDGPVADLLVRLTHGRPGYVRAVLDTMAGFSGPARQDPVSGLAAALEPGGRLATACAHSYELRLHRARGYGALKAILEILADSEPLTLTQISQQLGRTPGSTKDYLSWLEDVDLVSVQRKRYRFRDPILRLWVRVHCRAAVPDADTLASEVQAYVAACAG